jgi:ribosome biogenesis GTPase
MRVAKDFDLDEGFSTEQIRRSRNDRERRKDIRHKERHSPKVFETAGRDLITARILRTEGAYLIAETAPDETIRCRTIKSTVSGNPTASLVAVGDRVLIDKSESDIAVIREVLPRKTKLSRRAHTRRDQFEQVIAANIDYVGIVQSASEPPFRTGIIDRYIVAALEGELTPIIILNKSDLLAQDERAEFIAEALIYYKSIGYEHYLTSTTTTEGIDDLKDILHDKTIVFAGKSGVGKSSLLNTLCGEEIAKTQVLMKKGLRGMHTTTTVAMLPLPDHSGYVVDTPGIKEFFHFDLEPDQIRFRFVEFLELQHQCKMTNCLHIHEPGCAVSEAVDDDIIPEWRYNSYLAFWEEAERERKSRIGGI